MPSREQIGFTPEVESNKKEVAPKPMSSVEVLNELDRLEEDVYQYEENENPSSVELASFEEKQTAELVERLLGEKEKFESVFETERGSVYFVCHTGESFRFKKTDNGYKSQQMMKHIYYLKSDVAKQLHDEMKNGLFQFWLMKQEIEADSNPAEGLTPFEMCVRGHQEGEFDIVPTTVGFKIARTEKNPRKDEPQFYAGYHIGHEISRIISGEDKDDGSLEH
ncbi:MAG: hypothetical protein V1738_04515 [Patescibacteria group bacterium]